MAEDTSREPQGSCFLRTVSEGRAQGVTSVCCGLLRSDSHGCGKGYKPKCKEFLLDLKSENTQAGVWL